MILLTGKDSLPRIATPSSRGIALITIMLVAVGCIGPFSPNENPTATISSPEDGTVVVEGTPITFRGSGSDTEDGSLTGNSLQWTSDVDGNLGTGESVTVTLSSANTHQVTLTVVDSDGVTDEETIEIAINRLPSATIEAPSQDTVVREGDTIEFRGSGDDAEDGSLTGNSLQWTSDLDGDLGTGTSTSVVLSPTNHQVVLSVTDSEGTTDTAEVTVEVNPVWAQVSAGGSHTCGVTVSGTALCWGNNQYGQLGDESRTNRSEPVQVAGNLTLEQMSVGFDHTCGLTENGVAYCWGRNRAGGLGDGTMANRTEPVKVRGNLTLTHVSSGQFHTCGVATSGVAYCWGYNEDGQLGDGTRTDRLEPVQVAGNLTFTTVSAGGDHTCGITETGAAFCWGRNDWGQLGDGSTTSRLEPVQVAGDLTFSQLSAGGVHTCAVADDETAYCWGANRNGRVGDGTINTDRTEPTQVAGNLSYSQVGGGGFHSCGVANSGTPHCWGGNQDGQLGDGTTTDRAEPTRVSGDLMLTGITTGLEHTCAATSGGSAYCWGRNVSGQLGDGSTTGRLAPVQVTDP